MLKKTQVMTFPRSGHHYMVRTLRAYFGDRLKYCDLYGHCKKVPCKDPSTTLQKNHDFSHCTQIISGWSYIIQYRHPAGTLVSFYEFSVNKGTIPDNRKSWLSFYKKKIEDWKIFIRRWVKNDIGFKVNYSDLVGNNRKEVFSNIIKHIDVDAAIDEENLNSSLQKEKISLRNVKDFKYYDRKIFDYFDEQWKIHFR